MIEPTRQMGPELWIVNGDPVRMFRIPFETRMTIARLRDGGLWMHSPVAMSDERLAFIKELGEVTHIVAPTGMHNLFVDVWHRQFPRAIRWVEPGVPKRAPELRYDHLLEDGTEVPWRDEIDHVHVNGSSMLNELVFFHKATKAVIFTDILQNHDPSADNWFWRAVKRANGLLAPATSSPRDWRMTVHDKEAVRAAVARMLAWDFDILIVNHGLCVEKDAKSFVRQTFSWLEPISR